MTEAAILQSVAAVICFQLFLVKFPCSAKIKVRIKNVTMNCSQNPRTQSPFAFLKTPTISPSAMFKLTALSIFNMEY